MAFFGLFGKKENKDEQENLDKGLARTKESLFKKLGKIILGKHKVDDDVLDELEEVLITSDVGVETTLKIIKRIEERVKKDAYSGSAELNEILREEIGSLLEETDREGGKDEYVDHGGDPYVIMVVGINGVGKTTTIGKLANRYKKAG